MARRDHFDADPVHGSGDVSATKIGKEISDDADRVGDLPSDLPRSRAAMIEVGPLGLESDPGSDPGSDPDPEEHEVWFEAEALAAASRVELGARVAQHHGLLDVAASGELLRRAPASEQLLEAISSPGISLAELPGWPSSGAAGQGLGPALAELVGELRPGDSLILTGASRGVGRTSLLAQLSDGLALRREPARPQTPVLCIVDSTPRLWRARSLARWSGLDARVFVDPSHARREPQLAAQIESFDQGSWAELRGRQRFADARSFAAPDGRHELLAALRQWRGELEPEQPSAVWPILVVDPLEQLARDPVEVLAELEQLAVEEGLIVLASCDDPGSQPTHTRRMDRHVGARLRATTSGDGELEIELCHRRLGPGGRARLRWDRASGRIEPEP